jgi:hypothetical protein
MSTVFIECGNTKGNIHVFIYHGYFRTFWDKFENVF